MVALRDLQPASFKGARFLVPKDHLDLGRNTVLHKYPAKPGNGQYAEDNGGIPNEFHLTAYLHGPNLQSDWASLKSALNSPGPGTLNHPWDGNRLCQHHGPAKVTRDDKDSGVLEITLTFYETLGAGVFPSIAGVIAASISGLAGNAIASALGSFAANFQLPQSATSQTYIASLMGGLTGPLNDALGSVSGVAAATHVLGVNSLNGLAEGFSSVAGGQDLAGSITTALNDYGQSGAFQ